MNFENRNPQTRLIPENKIMVAIGLKFMVSPIQPIDEAIAPMKNTYIMYLMVVASESNVHLALAKNEKVTAMQNAPKLASAWLVSNM